MRLMLSALVMALALGGWQFYRAERLAEALALEGERLEALAANRDRWHERTVALSETLRRERERARQAEQAVAELHAALDELDAGYGEAVREARQAPPEHDGPVAPVLRRALEVLP